MPTPNDHLTYILRENWRVERETRLSNTSKLTKASFGIIRHHSFLKFRELKPSLATKRELLRGKLKEVRYEYKDGLPGYNELLSHEDVRAHKAATIKDVKMLLEGNIKETIKKTEAEAIDLGRRKKRKCPQASKRILLFTKFATRSKMIEWVADCCNKQRIILKAKQEEMIQEANRQIMEAKKKREKQDKLFQEEMRERIKRVSERASKRIAWQMKKIQS